MNEINSITLMIKQKKKPIVKYRSEYDVNMCQEVKKRWMVFGVLLSVALAVVCPRVGAPGGALHTEVVSWVAVAVVCFTSGLGTSLGAVRALRVRLCALSALHAHVAAPALAAAFALALRDARLDRRIVEGALVLCSRGPCGWLATALRRGASPAAPVLAAFNYLVSLIATPLAIRFFCGETSFPMLSSVLWTACATVGPFLLGTWWGRGAETPWGPASPPRAACSFMALLLLYIDCCTLLHETAGALHVTDVLATLFLEVSIVSMTVASSSLYVHFGLLRPRECRALAVAAASKAPHGWATGAGCTASGLARLPAVFLAPSQALLLVALYGANEDNGSEEDLLHFNC